MAALTKRPAPSFRLDHFRPPAGYCDDLRRLHKRIDRPELRAATRGQAAQLCHRRSQRYGRSARDVLACDWTNANSLSGLFEPIHLGLHITKWTSLAVAFASRAM